MTRLELIKRIVSKHEELEKLAGKVPVHTAAYEAHMSQLGSHLAEQNALCRHLGWLQDISRNGIIQMPDTPLRLLYKEAEPFEEFIILGFLRGQSVEDMASDFYEDREDDYE